MENSVESTPAGGVEAETSTHMEAVQQTAQEKANGRDSKTEESGEDDLMRKAHDMMERIIETRTAPSPRLLHALASMLEQEEARFIHESGLPSSNNARSSHNVGRLGNLLRENDEFFELVSSKFLSDARYTTGVRAAAGRLILACASTWVYPHIFEDDVLENIKQWAMDDILGSGEDLPLRLEASGQVASDPLMLKTYATGLLALALHGNGPVVEDVLTSGLAAKLMHFLRMRVFGEMNASQKDVTSVPENRQSVGGNSGRLRDDGKSRLRHVADISRLDFVRLSEETISEEQIADKDNEKGTTIKEKCAEDYLEDDDELIRAKDTVDVSDEVIGMLHVEDDNIDHTPEDKRRRKEWREVMCKLSGNKSLKDEDGEENLREDPSKRRAERGVSRHRGKARASESVAEAEKCMTALGTGIRLGTQIRTNKDRTSSKLDTNLDHRSKQDGKLSDVGHVLSDKDDIDDSDKVCKVGTKDISEFVKRARRAAEAEARAANAPIAAVKAAGDAAAELVKTTAAEELSNTNDEELAFEAASTAATTVVDAALSTDVSRKGIDIIDKGHDVVTSDFERGCELEENLILDSESIGRLREQFCVQCLERLGEYVEVLGPVLHEKGVDVCLALLQRHSKADDSSTTFAMLSDVLKLICALAAHRKFAALFVDRGGVQKLLAVPRVSDSFSGISMCLFAIGSHQAIMERVCALPLDIVHTVVQLALQLLDCSQDHARKHAALFFGASFVFRAVLDAFDANDGLQKMLNLLRNAANIRSGVGNGPSGMSSTSPRNDRTSAEVLTVAEKQIAYHTCVALRQYFRAQLILLVDTLRPNKGHRGGARSAPNTRAAYKPIDISNEAVEAIFMQLQRDRKIGPAFVRARWPAVEKFLSCNGHTILLELSQAPTGERYLHDLALYALGVLQIVTLVPNARRLVVGATLSNERLGMAVILDAASGASHVDPEVIHAALLVLVNLVCPPPSLSSKPVSTFQGTNVPSSQAPNGSLSEGRERNVDRNAAERALPLFGQDEARDRNGDQNNNGERNGLVAQVILPGSSQVAASSPTAALVGDRRISLGPGAGCAGLAAYMEQGYRQAREAVRANNGIKVLLHLLHPRTLLNPNNLDSIRAIACRVLLGLAKDDTIAHILTKLQVGKLLSELVRDAGSQIAGATGEQGKYQAELSQVAMELIAIVTNAGRASTLAATDAAAPTLRRIERAAIAAATPITYHSKELLQLIHEHLVASGLSNSAVTLLKEAHLTPLPSLAAPSSLSHRTSVQEASGVQFLWPSGRVPGGFLTDPSSSGHVDDSGIKSDLSLCSLRKKSLSFSSNISVKTPQATQQLTNKAAGAKDARNTSGSTKSLEFCTPVPKLNSEVPDLCLKSPNTLPMKRKAFDRDTAIPLSTKRLAIPDPASSSPIYMTPTVRKSNLSVEIEGPSGTPSYVQRDKVDDIACNQQILGSYHGTPGVGQVSSYYSQPGLLADPQSGNNERATLDSLVVQYLKHQHRQCPAPITTLPPLSLLHPHLCPEPSGALDAPFNTAGRLSTREFRTQYGGMHGHRRDRQFVFSRFRPWRTCRDEAALLTSITFLDSSSRIATGSHMGELKIFDTSSGNVLESHVCHQSPVTLVECSSCGNWPTPGSKLLLSSGNFDVRLWDSSAIASGPLHAFENCRAARFNHSGSMFAAISLDTSRREILLYDVQSGKLEQTLSDSSSGSSGFIRSQTQSVVHFSPSDTMLLCNGVLWDHRVQRHVHRFDQFTDYGGGGFHPAGNEVIINSEVWDLRKFRLLRSVPSLDQTVITFNPTGDIIYATLRRNLEDIMTALHPRRARNPLYKAFRTMDAVHYSDIATTVVDRCVLDLATEPTDSFIGLVTMDDSDEMDSSARIYEVGRRRPTDDDSDPDDGLESDEEDECESEADEEEGEDGLDDGESDMDISNDEDDSVDEGEDGDFDSNDEDGMGGIAEIISDDDGSHGMGGSFSSEEEGSMGEFDDEFLII
ncbi:DDB1- and CUL4-associated factor homolog 1 isoform X2 [Cryptomeria japonica]|uniref:DDB1- and CUL4-associated factor homolog 1 isoform X2 n=1 Tax=Cryptomeria japonica TaxID=3369 RepID=UPI0027DA5953|nr:DDB1- and CUL4-associated factor homolog 1 isoform X2 [Cryptomeria japonica]